MPKRKSRKLVSVTVNLPEVLVEALDDIAREAETTRTDIIEGLLEFGLENIDEIFPPEN